MSRLEFPAGFRWGCATASYQIEGAWKADDKGESIWDRFAHTPGRVAQGHTGDVACDSYHRFDEDIALLRQMNCTSYRFSVAWPRIQPTGRGPVNAKGLDYYRRVCDALLAAGIRPFPTLYHWDLPQALEDDGGWPNRDLAGRFADYADIVARGLGDLVDDWMIFNEPFVFTAMGYLLGIHAPGRASMDDFLRATHTVNLAQGQACQAMRATASDARIGSAFSMSACEPARDEAEDAEAAERWHRFTNLWFLDPAQSGQYPAAFVDGVPEAALGMRPGDAETVRADLDFIGINLYTRTLVRHAPEDTRGLAALPVGGMGGDDGPKTDFGWEVWPNALRDVVLRIHHDYDAPEIEITENGCAYADRPGEDGRIEDRRRIDFYAGYLAALHEAIDAGARVTGYHAWSLLDNFEWSEGYAQRFGLTWVDFESGDRTLKDSGHWYARVADENGLDH